MPRLTTINLEESDMLLVKENQVVFIPGYVEIGSKFEGDDIKTYKLWREWSHLSSQIRQDNAMKRKAQLDAVVFWVAVVCFIGMYASYYIGWFK